MIRLLFGVALLLIASSAHAQSRFDWKPTLAAAVGQSLDIRTTSAFLHNGSGCLESNPFLGPRPSTSRLLLSAGVVVAGTATLTYFSRNQSKAMQRLVRGFGYAIGGIGGLNALHNVRTCGF